MTPKLDCCEDLADILDRALTIQPISVLGHLSQEERLALYEAASQVDEVSGGDPQD